MPCAKARSLKISSRRSRRSAKKFRKRYWQTTLKLQFFFFFCHEIIAKCLQELLNKMETKYCEMQDGVSEMFEKDLMAML